MQERLILAWRIDVGTRAGVAILYVIVKCGTKVCSGIAGVDHAYIRISLSIIIDVASHSGQ